LVGRDEENMAQDSVARNPIIHEYSFCQTRFRKPLGIAQKDCEFCDIMAQNPEPVVYTLV
jgi:hypothetical protein